MELNHDCSIHLYFHSKVIGLSHITHGHGSHQIASLHHWHVWFGLVWSMVNNFSTIVHSRNKMSVNHQQPEAPQMALLTSSSGIGRVAGTIAIVLGGCFRHCFRHWATNPSPIPSQRHFIITDTPTTSSHKILLLLFNPYYHITSTTSPTLSQHEILPQLLHNPPPLRKSTLGQHHRNRILSTQIHHSLTQMCHRTRWTCLQ